MATIEDALVGLQTILTEDFPGQLNVVSAKWNDGIVLEPIRTFEWEETRGSIKSTPAALMIGEDETDTERFDQVRDATILLYIILTDRSKQFLTKKLYRNADALRRSLRPARNRTLRGSIISAKVLRVKYSPTFMDRTNLFMRDLQATIVLRIPRGDA